MRSRGLSNPLGAGARKSFVLFWTALFVCSLLLQYVVIAAPVLAAHDQGLFELDGNATDDPAIEPDDDWNSTDHALADDPRRARTLKTPLTTRATSRPVAPRMSTTSRSGPTPRTTSRPTRTRSSTRSPRHTRRTARPGSTSVPTGSMARATRSSASGSSRARSAWTATAASTASTRTATSSCVSDFTNGGSVSQIKIYEWLNGSLSLKDERRAVRRRHRRAGMRGRQRRHDHVALAVPGQDRLRAASPQASSTRAASTSTPSSAARPPASPASLPRPARRSPRRRSSRTSRSAASIPACHRPSRRPRAHSSADFGGSVTDSATLSGTDGPASGSVKFFVCGPSATDARLLDRRHAGRQRGPREHDVQRRDGDVRRPTRSG